MFALTEPVHKIYLEKLLPRLQVNSGSVHHWSIKIAGLFQDFPGPYLQNSRTRNSQEN